MPRALITGLTGQDGSTLADLLLSKGYEVHGCVRRVSSPNFSRIEHILDKIQIHAADLSDQSSLTRVVDLVRPHELYNLGAQSYVTASWSQPLTTADVTGMGVLRVLEAIRQVDPSIRFYQASSSEMFGKVWETPQNEQTPFYPRSPYGVAKVFGHWATVNYRESYGIYAVSGVLFNHESSRRGIEFVTRKITHAVARIKCGLQRELRLGNTQSKRDFGYAPDYVRAMWMMLQQDKPDDYVIATGETHSIQEFVELAFERVGLDWQKYVMVDPVLFRPAEVDLLLGDASKARSVLGWGPTITFEQLVATMVDADMLLVG